MINEDEGGKLLRIDNLGRGAVQDSRMTKRLSYILELVGPAGAGKTTVLQALSQSEPHIGFPVRPLRDPVDYAPFLGVSRRLLRPGELWKFMRSQGNDTTGISRRSYLLALSRSASQVLWSLMCRDSDEKWPTWLEIKLMICLDTLHRVLACEKGNRPQILVLDQGPVYTLGWLQRYGSAGTKGAGFARWWHTALARWSATLDLVVRLDAEDAVLIRRVSARATRHRLKGTTETEAYEFLSSYRMIFDQIISMLMVEGEPHVLCVDTGQESLNQIVDNIVAMLTDEADTCSNRAPRFRQV